MRLHPLDELYGTFRKFWKSGIAANFSASTKNGITSARLSVECNQSTSKPPSGTQEKSVKTSSPAASARGKKRKRGRTSAARSLTRATKHRAQITTTTKAECVSPLAGVAQCAKEILEPELITPTRAAISVFLPRLVPHKRLSKLLSKLQSRNGAKPFPCIVDTNISLERKKYLSYIIFIYPPIVQNVSNNNKISSTSK